MQHHTRAVAYCQISPGTTADHFGRQEAVIQEWSARHTCKIVDWLKDTETKGIASSNTIKRLRKFGETPDGPKLILCCGYPPVHTLNWYDQDKFERAGLKLESVDKGPIPWDIKSVIYSGLSIARDSCLRGGGFREENGRVTNHEGLRQTIVERLMAFEDGQQAERLLNLLPPEKQRAMLEKVVPNDL